MIKLNPEIIFKAKEKNLPLGAFRLWYIARDFDNGNGFIPKKEFRQHVKNLGINKSNYHRWLDQAGELGMIEKQGEVYRLSGLEHVARNIGANQLQRPVKVPIDKFLQKRWLATVWSGYLLHFSGRPVTRGTLEKLTGIAPSTQLEYEKLTKVKKIANYAHICDPAENPMLALDSISYPGIYGKGGKIRQRLGNTYIPAGVQLGNKGRTKLVNKALCNEDSSRRTSYALYCLDDEELARKKRANRRWADAKNLPSCVYLHYADLPQGSVWQAILF